MKREIDYSQFDGKDEFQARQLAREIWSENPLARQEFISDATFTAYCVGLARKSRSGTRAAQGTAGVGQLRNLLDELGGLRPEFAEGFARNLWNSDPVTQAEFPTIESCVGYAKGVAAGSILVPARGDHPSASSGSAEVSQVNFDHGQRPRPGGNLLGQRLAALPRPRRLPRV